MQQPMYAIRTETKSLLFVVVSENDKETRTVPTHDCFASLRPTGQSD